MKPATIIIIALALLATAALAIGVTAALVDDVTGDYCLSTSASNGHAPLTYEHIPRTNEFRRGSDCPEEEQVTIYIEDGTFASKDLDWI